MESNRFDPTGKVALVTGTSRGLGQYFARALAKAGADLIITSRRPAADAAAPTVYQSIAVTRHAA